MSVIRKNFICWGLLLIAAGCASVPKPPAKTAIPEVAPKSSGDAVPGKLETPKVPASGTDAPTNSLAERYLLELSQVQSMSADQSRRELNELVTSKRLDKPRRLRLAAALARDEQGEWERAIKMLEGLANDDDPRSQVLMDLLRKSWRARLTLRQQDARITELQQRIQQIKTLEKDLQQRSETP